MAESSKVLQSYFGKWGGFFVPDPMTPALDELTASASKWVKDSSFAKKVDELAEVEVSAESFASTQSQHVFSMQSPVRREIAAGYALLAKETAREVVAGAYDAEEAKLISDFCHKLGLPLSIWLDVKTGSNEALVKLLSDSGASVNTAQCRELFDDPDMYSFQKYIANPMKYMWMPVHTHSGPAPFPAITSFFASLAAKKMIAAAEKKFAGKKLAFAAPAVSGLTLAGLLGAKGNGMQLSSYEPKADSQREDCYLGTYTAVTTVGKKEFVLSPEIVHAWEAGSIKRVETVAPINEFAKGDSSVVCVVVEE
jgi:tryptophan synthase beta subunit